MANLKNVNPSLYMPNLLHFLDTIVENDPIVVHAIVEVSSHSINKYELITETGHLKLDRVGYSSLSYPFTYGAIPKTYDLDDDPLDIIITNVTEPLIPGSVVEARVIGLIKFTDGDEVDDKVVAVLAGDKRVDHIKSIQDLGEYWEKETVYYWEHYKDLKKPGTVKVNGILGIDEAKKVIEECMERYETEYLPKLELKDDECCCGACGCND